MSPTAGAARDPARPADPALRLAIILVFANLGLSLLNLGLVAIFHTGAWGEAISSVLVAGLSVRPVLALRDGSRDTYRFLYILVTLGVAAIAYAALLTGPYPAWARAEQVAVALVRIGLLVAVLLIGTPARQRGGADR